MKTLRLVTDLPAGNAEFALLEDWADRLGTASGGDLVIQIFAAGQLVGGFETVDAVQSGIADLFYTSPNNHPGTFLGVEGYALPLSASAGAASAAAAWSTIEDGAFNPSALKLLTAHFSGSDVFAAPTLPDEIAGLKVRSFGATSDVISLMGNLPLLLPAGEIYPAIQTGVMDAAILPSYFANALQIDDVSTFYTSPDGALLSPQLRAIGMSESGWNALTAAERSLLTAETGLAQSMAFGAQTKALLDAALAQAGTTEFSPAQMAQWEEAVATVRAALDPEAKAIADAFAAALAEVPAITDVTGTPDDDILNGTTGADNLSGLAGDDVLMASLGQDTLDGGEGRDTADYSAADGPVSLNLTLGKALGAFDRDSLVSIENLIASDYNDGLIGDGGANVLNGGLGDDIIRGKGGNDTMIGGGGSDRIFGEAGEDTVSGGGGSDVIKTADGDDTVNAGGGDDVARLGGGDDTAEGGTGDDRLFGNRGNDTLQGDDGDDRLFGGGNSDSLFGGNGNDALRGESGQDTLVGEAGDDSLYGGANADVFVFLNDGMNGSDRIKDWEDGLDRIDLTDFGLSTFAEAQALASNSGSSAMKLDFGDGNQVVIENFRFADFDQSDVILSG